MRVSGNGAAAHLQHPLRQRKISPADKRRMGVWHNNPVLRINAAPVVYLVAHGPCKLLGHIALIHRVGEYPPNGFGIPQPGEPPAFILHLLLDGRGRNLRLVQPPGNGGAAGAAKKQPENLADNRGSFFVRQQVIFIGRVNAVAVGRQTGQELALPLENIERGPNFGAGIGGVKVIEHILENRHLLRAITVPGGIILVVDCDESHAKTRENLF